jgi:hypothetical protein
MTHHAPGRNARRVRAAGLAVLGRRVRCPACDFPAGDLPVYDLPDRDFPVCDSSDRDSPVYDFRNRCSAGFSCHLAPEPSRSRNHSAPGDRAGG